MTSRRLRPAAAFLVGATLGGLTIGLVLYVAGAPLRGLVPWWSALGIIAVCAVLCLLWDVGILPDRSRPGTRRQVPESVFLDNGLVGGSLQFGFEMGTGVRTYLTAAVPLLPAAALLVGGLSAADAMAAGFGFGLARGLVPMSRILARDRAAWDRRVARWAAVGLYSRTALAVTLPAMAVYFLG